MMIGRERRYGQYESMIGVGALAAESRLGCECSSMVCTKRHAPEMPQMVRRVHFYTSVRPMGDHRRIRIPGKESSAEEQEETKLCRNPRLETAVGDTEPIESQNTQEAYEMT